MALKKPKLDRQELLDRRYDLMKQAWELDKMSCQSPFHNEVAKCYGKFHLGISTKDVHHLMGRTNTGEFDGLEYLITLCRCEHEACENGHKGRDLKGVEYEYLILWRLRGRPNDRWHLPRRLLEQKISVKRLKEIREIE